MAKFPAIMDTFIENGGRIKFDLTGLDPAIKGNVTEWELRQVLGKKLWAAATDFFRNGERLTGDALKEAVKPWRQLTNGTRSTRLSIVWSNIACSTRRWPR